MKRLLLAAGLALALHGLLLYVKGEWLVGKTVLPPRPEPISIALSYRHPEVRPEPVLKNPEPPKVKPVTPKKEPKKKVIKHIEKKITPIKKETQPVIPPVAFSKIEDEPAEEPVHREEEISRAVESSEETTEEVIETRTYDTPPPPPPLKEAVPAYRLNPAPEYPKRARRRGYEGTVLLEVLVNPRGEVDDLRLSSSSGHPVLDHAAMDSVKSWIFKPAKRGDQAVEMWVEVPVRFELR